MTRTRFKNQTVGALCLCVALTAVRRESADGPLSSGVDRAAILPVAAAGVTQVQAAEVAAHPAPVATPTPSSVARAASNAEARIALGGL
jgi:hypothetical protein